MKEKIAARNVTLGMTIGMHGRKVKVIERWEKDSAGYIRLRGEDDLMYVRPGTTLTRYTDESCSTSP